MKLFQGQYCAYLCSDDMFDPDMPLAYSKAKGGTMVMWKNSLEQYIKPLSPPSSSMLPILFYPPGVLPSIHIALYLPTAGNESTFTEQIAVLSTLLLDLKSRYPKYPVFVRGDANVNPKNKTRHNQLKALCRQFNLVKTNLNHPTYHHFVGNGSSDSELDILLKEEGFDEQLLYVFCNIVDPCITSHHDIILSQYSLPRMIQNRDEKVPISPAPRNNSNRIKIKWTEEGSQIYHDCVAPCLNQIQRTLLSSNSEASLSILLSTTNSILDMCAQGTNDFINLSIPSVPTSTKKPKQILLSERKLRHINNKIRRLPANSLDEPRLRSILKQARIYHRRLLRHFRMNDSIRRNQLLEGLGTSDPEVGYRTLKKLNRSATSKVSSLKVGHLTYNDDQVPDGIYESIRSLKTEPVNFKDQNSPDYETEYQIIMDICKKGNKIPKMSQEASTKILKSLKKNVNDFYNITPLHYLHAGPEGLALFHNLINAIIEDINISGDKALNSIYARVLYKGHGKDKENSRSYRTISTCPLLSKALDVYVRDLSEENWNGVQADTQYLGRGMSHELACLLLTETLQYSINVKKLPVYALFLDAKSAFDRVIRKILVRNFFISGTDDQRLVYLDGRLGNRLTFVDYDNQIMGPISDTRGLEQGGVISSDAYKIYNNEQAISSQSSNLGVKLFDQCISCISLADDSVLLSNDIWSLKNLLYITELYCSKYNVELVPDKTKLIAFSKTFTDTINTRQCSPIEINGSPLAFSEEVDHLGVLRTARPDNMSNIMLRISAHRSKLFSILPAGLSRHHRAKTSSCLIAERIYALPVLLSGLPALVLSRTELEALNNYHKNILKNLMKVPKHTPDSAVYFLAGSLPVLALLHLRQFSLFNMICHLPDNPLHILARRILVECKPTSCSWFHSVRNLCIQYNLPHPLILLQSPVPKSKFKIMCNQNVHDYWRRKLSSQCDLPSLKYFNPDFLSLKYPHPLWFTLDSNPYNVEAARIQALFLIGRYPTESLCRYWSSNPDGICLQETCRYLKLKESIEHVLLHCAALSDNRRRLFWITWCYAADKCSIWNILEQYLFNQNDDKILMQFLLDCSSLPLVIEATQNYGQCILEYCFTISRTWCRSMHVSRMKYLGRKP